MTIKKDDPVDLSGGYQPTTHDRRKIDNQILELQAELLALSAGDGGGVGPAGPAGPAGADGAGAPLEWSPVDYGTRAGTSTTNESANVTTGVAFALEAAATITGVRFAWAGTARSIKVAVWEGAGGHALLASKTHATMVTGPGIYTVAFDTPYVVPAAQIGRLLLATVHDTTGTNYCKSAVILDDNFNALEPTGAFRGGSKLLWVQLTRWASGDAAPLSAGGADRYPVEPVFA